MSVSNVSSSASVNASTGINRASAVKQGRQDFSQLLSSLQSGDVSGAQQAFAAMQQLLPGFQAATQAPASSSGTASANTVTSTLGTDFSALGTALNSGSLSGAQDAVAKLQQDAQSYRQEHQLGHLERAENVYKSMQQSALGNTSSSNPLTASGSANPLGADMAALGQALQSGSVTSAQDAYAKLQQDLQSIQQGPGRHHHHHSALGTQNSLSSYLANSVIGSAATTANSAGNTVQVSV